MKILLSVFISLTIICFILFVILRKKLKTIQRKEDLGLIHTKENDELQSKIEYSD